MTLSLLSLPLSSPIPGLIKKKRVLLVDASPVKRELRAEAMRKLGVDVDCACDISEARSWWRADLYNLVLINPENELGRDKFCDDVRGTATPQSLAFLVGKPEYIAHSPGVDVAFSAQAAEPVPEAQAPEVAPEVSQRWGIMEASRRISKVRSVSVAHTMAMRNRPTPPRDMEKRPSRRADADSLLLAQFRGEEIQ
jgi:hypothetical protein